MHRMKSFDKRQLLVMLLLFLAFYQPVIGPIRSTYYIPVLAFVLIIVKRIPILDICKTKAGNVVKGLFIIELYLLISLTMSGGQRSYLVYPIHLVFGILYIYAVKRVADMERIGHSEFESIILCTGWVQSTLCVVMCICPFAKAAHWRYLLCVMTNAAERQRFEALGIFRFYGIAGPNQYLSSIGLVSAMLFLLALYRMIRNKAFGPADFLKTFYLLVPAFLDGRLGMILALVGSMVQFGVYYLSGRDHLKFIRILLQLGAVVFGILLCGLLVQKASFLRTIPEVKSDALNEIVVSEEPAEISGVLSTEMTASASDSSVVAEEDSNSAAAPAAAEADGNDVQYTEGPAETATASEDTSGQKVVQPNDPTQNPDVSIQYTANNWSTVVVDFLVAVVTRDTDSKVYEWYGGLLPSNWNVPKGIHLLIGDGSIPDEVVKEGELIGRSDSGFARLLCVGGLILLILQLSLFIYVLKGKPSSLFPLVCSLAVCFLLAELKGNPYAQTPVVMALVLMMEYVYDTRDKRSKPTT